MDFTTALLLVPIVLLVVALVVLGVFVLPILAVVALGGLIIWVVANANGWLDAVSEVVGVLVLLLVAGWALAVLKGGKRPEGYRKPVGNRAACPTCRQVRFVGRRGMMKYHMNPNDPS